MLFKENLLAYWQLFKGLSTVGRIVMFEKFSAVFFFFYLLCVLSLAFILSALHWGMAVIVVLSGVMLFTKVLRSFAFLKRSLIRKGDRVEYADPTATDTAGMFKTATVTLKMHRNEVKRSKLMAEELMEGNRHFYLVQTDKGPKIIAYDWIIGLSSEFLEEESQG